MDAETQGEKFTITGIRIDENGHIIVSARDGNTGSHIDITDTVNELARMSLRVERLARPWEAIRYPSDFDRMIGIIRNIRACNESKNKQIERMIERAHQYEAEIKALRATIQRLTTFHA